jgi:ABC-type multidrug transport system ATPase subunit
MIWTTPGSVNPRASIGAPDPFRRPATGGAPLTSSTPDALWSAPSLRVLRPAAVTCSDLRHGRDLNHCSLSVPAGARLLVVSDPDASASMLLRVLAGLSRADRGEVRIAGSRDASADGWSRRLAYVGPDPGMHSWMTPVEALRLTGDLLDLPPEETAIRVERAIDWARIPSVAAARPMSRGGDPLMQRTGLAAALIGDPEVLLLDEPLRAIEARERARLLRLPGPRRTVLLASRYPASEVGLMSHVAYLRNGRVELIAPIDALERAELPLSHRGIAALAELRAARMPARPLAPA